MKKTKENKKNNKGFSLVELIVVIAIMAVLVGVLAPQFIKYVEKSREATDIQNMQQMMTAVETYAADNENSTITSVITITTSGAISVNPADALKNAGLTAPTMKSTKWFTTDSLTLTYNGSKWELANYKSKGDGVAPYYELKTQLGTN